MYANFISIQKKSIENTQKIDLATLRQLGVEGQFLHLTSRIGIAPEFWIRGYPGYEMDTREFLFSLQLKLDANEARYIKFCLCNTTQRVYLTTLRKWFGFHEAPTAETLSFREGWDRDVFWEKITGIPKARNDALRARFISHPVLRIIQRALACTIFARGETLNRGNQIDLMLMDSMLHPTTDIPDLALLMVHHWLDLQKSRRPGGKIKIGMFVEIIKKFLGLDDFLGRGICPGPKSLNPESLQLQHFITIHRGPAGHSDQYDWRFANGTLRRLPFAAPIDLEDHSTWLITTPPPSSSQPRLTRDVPSSFSRPAPSPAPPGPASADHTLRDLYTLMSSIRDTQLAQGTQILAQGTQILDIQRQTTLHTEQLDESMRDFSYRMGDIEDQFHDWRFDDYYH